MLVVEFTSPKNFPISLIYYILSYHHRPQPKMLLDDIVHNYNSKNLIHERYQYIWRNVSICPNVYLEYLENDIYRYANNNVPSMYGYTPHFYKILLRLPFINPVKRHLFFGKSMYDDSDYTYKVYKYIQNLDFRHNYSFENNENEYENYDLLLFKINVLWGLFTINERDFFIYLNTVS